MFSKNIPSRGFKGWSSSYVKSYQSTGVTGSGWTLYNLLLNFKLILINPDKIGLN